jgi:caffeoyl-CoA O-methyltransferase
MQPLKRREFVAKTSTAVGLAALLENLGQAPAWAAAAPDPQLKARRDVLLAEMEANPGISVPRVDGEFLNMLVYLTNAQQVLEVGTFRGYSGIWMSTALEQTGGKLTTIDIDPEKVRESKANFQKAALTDRITSLEGDAHQVITTVSGPLDLIFLDAEKGGEMDYFEKLFPKLRPGGIMALHNAISHKEAMKPYLQMVKQHPQLVSVVLSLSMRDGFSVSFKKRG